MMEEGWKGGKRRAEARCQASDGRKRKKFKVITAEVRCQKSDGRKKKFEMKEQG